MQKYLKKNKVIVHVLLLNVIWQPGWRWVWERIVVVLIARLCLTLWDPIDYSQPGSPVHGDFPGKNTGVGSHALLQGIFLTQDQTQVSCIAGRFFTIWATRQTLGENGYMCMYGWVPCCSPEPITTLLISYTPRYKIKSFNF